MHAPSLAGCTLRKKYMLYLPAGRSVLKNIFPNSQKRAETEAEKIFLL
jgi:hypothetical protein